MLIDTNRPKYLVVDMENSEYILDMSDDEKIDVVAKRVLARYLPAFKELAK